MIALLSALFVGCQKTNEPDGIFVKHSFYVLSYNTEKKNPNWVCWEICSSNKVADRKLMSFVPDPMIETPSPSNYRRTGYDLGHMCPAADMSFDYLALKETFFMSNITPQDPKLNRGDWKELEFLLHEEGKLTNIFCVAGTFWQGRIETIGVEKVMGIIA